MDHQKKNVGENALQKVVRLLGKFQDEVVEEGSGDYVDLVLEKGGCGNLNFIPSKGTPQRILIFRSLEDLTTFLEAGQLDRILMAG